MKLLLLISLSFVILSCGDALNASKPKPLNPNGDSELALLMRDMYEDGQRIKQEIKNGKKPEILNKFKEIHTAVATEPEKVATEEYRLYADAYLNAIELLEQADAENVEDSYHGMVQACITCHRAVCPGPIVRIKKLMIPQNK